MDDLTKGVTLDSPKKLEPESSGFMALHIEWVGECNYGEMYSVAQYYEQNGDLMRDPDVVFIKGKDLNYYPISYRQDGLGVDQETVVFKDGVVKWVHYSAQKQLVIFVNQWFRNLADQFKVVVK
jgi:hypothetical protein